MPLSSVIDFIVTMSKTILNPPLLIVNIFSIFLIVSIFDTFYILYSF